MMPSGHDADAFRRIVLKRFDMSLGQGLGKVAGKVFLIGHLGHFNDLMLRTLAGVEMGLAAAGVPHREGRSAGRNGFPAVGDGEEASGDRAEVAARGHSCLTVPIARRNTILSMSASTRAPRRNHDSRGDQHAEPFRVT